MKIDILKCVVQRDWPLLESCFVRKPMICSTGGLTLSEIDDLYSFLNHKGADFLMHCFDLPYSV